MKSLRFIVLAWSCAWSCGYAAEDRGAIPPAAAEGIRLRLQPSLITLPVESEEPLPIFIDADQLRGHQGKEIEGEGNVRLRRRGRLIFADWLRYDKPDDEVNARGNVLLEQRGDVVTGTTLRYNLETERGAIDNATYDVRMKDVNGRGAAERLVFEGQNKYRMEKGNYTTCEVGNNDWFVRASTLEIDKGRQIGTARDASVVFLGRPILYTPYLTFSLDRSRKSGFLSPTLGSSVSSGPEFSIPYYWNIAPNRDATFTPRIMAKRGLMVSSEFRYLEPSFAGEARYEILPNDQARNETTRYAFSLLHNHSFGYGWSGNLNLQKVSDDNYFTDLSTQIAATSRTILPRSGALARSGNWGNDGSWAFGSLVQRWQTLQTDPQRPVSPPYDRTQFFLNASKTNVAFTDLAFTSSVDQFTHPTLISGKRAYAYPSLSIPLQTSYAYVTPKMGVHYTQYDVSDSPVVPSKIDRTVPIFSTDTGLILERETAFYGKQLIQTLEPKIFYVYIPAREQNQIPNFDSGLQDINFATLYTENQFSGNDRINDANQVTIGISSRFLEAENGIERFRVGVAQRYYFKAQEVVLPGVAPRSSSNSDLLAALSGTIAPFWTVDAGWQYTTDTSQTRKLNTAVRYQPEPGKVMNASYRYTNGALLNPTQLAQSGLTQKETLRQIDLSAQWPITARLNGLARWNYSLQDGKLLEALGGVEYLAGCWIFRIVAHRFTTATTNRVSSIFMQLELNGLSQIGSNPLELLRRNISGYHRPEAQSAPPRDVIPQR